jgi:hypothetical protein
MLRHLLPIRYLSLDDPSMPAVPPRSDLPDAGPRAAAADTTPRPRPKATGYGHAPPNTASQSRASEPVGDCDAIGDRRDLGAPHRRGRMTNGRACTLANRESGTTLPEGYQFPRIVPSRRRCHIACGHGDLQRSLTRGGHVWAWGRPGDEARGSGCRLLVVNPYRGRAGLRTET